MSGASIAEEVALAIQSAGAEVGSGTSLTALLTPAVIGGNSWDTPTTPDAVEVAVIEDTFKRHEIDGSRILAGDKKLLFEAGGVIPRPSDTFVMSGQKYTIVEVWPLAPGGVDLLYTVQARYSEPVE